jgi:hypothetical protein
MASGYENSPYYGGSEPWLWIFLTGYFLAGQKKSCLRSCDQ